MSIEQYGWNDEWFAKGEHYLINNRIAGRVAQEQKGMYRVWTEAGTLNAEVSGKFRFQAAERGDFPAVGDWVILDARPQEGKGIIHQLLPRTSCFSRKVAGEVTDEQIVAANVDTIFIVMALNNDFNIRRLERYLTMAWESGANPAVVLSKSDLCDDKQDKVMQVEAVAFGVPVHTVSALQNDGLEELSGYLSSGRTVALLGSSGVGKSTIINAFAGRELQEVQEIRESDAKGRHTTTHREMFLLPQGGILIDTPGMRELQLWESVDGLKQSFEDVEAYALACRFRDCTHGTEPGCAVKAAIAGGMLDRERYESYLKLQKELAYLERKASAKARLAEKQRGRQLAKQVRNTKSGKSS
ncbi:ribosome biogenesis GTPase [Evansella caseinilytica]|uniref:Small ribosomal subunit biogenesis GTPase RsgA n=1 Tax=Evansella caseinilytica TaxID=1503961 RepID=A0A1H3V2H0_9BACI|nr:ribosome small subunit-dependent GTPase A [Evansella caseinilytica]SDZ68249.1 ribosome biogenesis GTPase [Evansella caseinilytica]